MLELWTFNGASTVVESVRCWDEDQPTIIAFTTHCDPATMLVPLQATLYISNFCFPVSSICSFICYFHSVCDVCCNQTTHCVCQEKYKNAWQACIFTEMTSWLGLKTKLSPSIPQTSWIGVPTIRCLAVITLKLSLSISQSMHSYYQKTPNAIDSAVDLYTICFIISNNVVKGPLAYTSMWHSAHTMQACMHISVYFKYVCVLCYLWGIQFLRNFIISLDHL